MWNDHDAYRNFSSRVQTIRDLFDERKKGSEKNEENHDTPVFIRICVIWSKPTSRSVL